MFSDRMVFVRAVVDAQWMSPLELAIYDSWFAPIVEQLGCLVRGWEVLGGAGARGLAGMPAAAAGAVGRGLGGASGALGPPLHADCAGLCPDARVSRCRRCWHTPDT